MENTVVDRQFFYTEHNNPNPRRDASNVPPARKFFNEEANKITGDAFSGSVGTFFCHFTAHSFSSLAS